MANLGLVETVLLAGLAIAIYYAYQLFFPTVSEPVEPETESKVESVVDNSVPMTVLYGSQTGTAEEFAGDFAKEAKAHGYNPTVVDLEEYEVENLQEEKFVVLLVATFGEGEATDSAQEFDNYLKELDRSEKIFENLTYAVFGLGNRQYEQFCEMGKRTDTSLADLGGKRLLELGIGDDDENIEDHFNSWKEKFFDVVDPIKLGRKSRSNSVVNLFEPEWKITLLTVEEGKASGYVSGYQPPTGNKDNIEMAKIKVNRELRQKTNRGSTKHIEFEISDLSVNYSTADNLGVCPRNDYKTCAKLAKRLNISPATVFTASAPGGRHMGVPSTCSVMDALLWHMDINNPPKKKLLLTLSQYATDSAEAKRLKYLTSSDGKKDYDSEIVRGKLDISGLFEKFPSLKVSFPVFLEICPKLQPRFYTISSSSIAQPNRVTITASVLEKGLCTTYLDTLRPDIDEAPIFVRPSTFRLPKEKSTPVIMIGPGTGLAPFMGFIQEFRHVRNETGSAKGEGPRVLYFGCRLKDEDFIYSDTLQKEAKEDGVLSELHTAFSREGKDKVYVQHLMRKNAASINKLLMDGGSVYVCGGTAMGREVKETLIQIVKEEGGQSKEEALKFVDGLSKKGKYIQELWSV
uniref:NADPH--hemoprotein reductase n=1 Tax=Amorphochlora amoebiformis TaxID=1561963 RepID=A0A7S0CS92_9EUKA|mmetsp:Transcript_12827/g.20276  ORF Transcript_12827/g.20276 Transcript_12827/m.20276 type:complete len:631 (+) Transcript_12827:64-1956(+)